jgi:hypothetical protein
MNLFGIKKNRYGSRDILVQLDKCAEEFTFPMLDNGYTYPVESRFSGYRDDDRWALIIEVFGFHNRAGGHDGIQNCVHIFGNCLDFEPGTNNSNFLYVTDNSPEGETFDQEYGDSLNLNVKTMLLRGDSIQIPRDPDFYASRQVELEAPPEIKIWEFLRGISKDHGDSFLATEEEIRARIPKDLPAIIRLNEWFHPDLADDEKPSECETFQMIARVLETGDLNEYRATKMPNNHWANWPVGGTL